MENRQEKVFTADQLRGLGTQLKEIGKGIVENIATGGYPIGPGVNSPGIEDRRAVEFLEQFVGKLATAGAESPNIGLRLPSGREHLLVLPSLVRPRPLPEEGEDRSDEGLEYDPVVRTYRPMQ